MILINFINKHFLTLRPPSAATHKCFRQSLSRIEKIYDNELPKLHLKFIESPEQLMKKLETSDYTRNTIINTFTHILKLLKLCDTPLHHYNKFLKVLNYHAVQRQINIDEELKEKMDFLPSFDKLREILKENIKNVDQSASFGEMKHLLILSLFVLTVPLKISEYTGMKINFIDDGNKYLYIDPDTDDMTLVFKENRIKVTDESLKKILNEWITGYNNTNYLLIGNEESKKSMNNKDIRHSLAIASKDILGVSLSNSDLRHSYMKYLMDLDPDIKQKIQLSKILGYKNTDRIDLHKII
jgi:integrase